MYNLQRTCRAVNKLHGKKCSIVRIEDIIASPSKTFNDGKLRPLSNGAKIEKKRAAKTRHFLEATDASEITEELGSVAHYLERLGYANEKTSSNGVYDESCFLFEWKT